MKTKLLGCLAATAMATAIVLATPAVAFRGGGPGGGGFHGGFGGGGFRGGLVTGRSVFGGTRFASAPFAGRHALVNRFHNFAFRNRFNYFAFRHRRFHNFAFFGFGVPFGYDYAAYGNGCWRWDGWQWINICYNYGGYNYGY
jgi:hypothetical protein